MCGIYGVLANKNSNYNSNFLQTLTKSLALYSESRGKDSSGICVLNNENFEIYKGSIRSKDLIDNIKVKKSLKENFSKSNKQIKCAFGHARLVTNGTQLKNENNQPVIKDKIITIHNGIIVNSEKIWKENKSIQRLYDIDTEIIPSLIRSNLNKGLSSVESLIEVFKYIEGTASLAIAFQDLSKFILATNNGSLYYITNKKRDILIFASENSFLAKLISKHNLKNKISDISVNKLMPRQIIEISFKNFQISKFHFDKSVNCFDNKFDLKKNIKLKIFNSNKYKKSIVQDLNKLHLSKRAKKDKKLLIYPIEKIKLLKRCKRCVLPETFPYIKFDSKGVCNYCNNYSKKNRPKSLNELKKLVEPYRSNSGKPDCIVPFSGGRDSMYTLHIIKKELNLNPIALTYDWGMVTDLARRNIARICGKLEIENIIVAADIKWKRDNINKNISAWLKNPDLGMIPLFMAGDKYFFYYTSQLQKQTGIKLNIWGINDLENTNFKTGFAGLKPEFEKEKIYSISMKNKLKLYSHIAKNVIMTPSYINQSVFDSIGSFISRYFISKSDYFHLFDYLRWDENLIEKTIIDQYDWETCIDTESTWRIGDGTASFYNYIYLLVAGFSENDTFRSNQIREGYISREKALEKIYSENKPRYNSIKWYLDIIGLDFEETIRTINNIKRLY